MAQVELGVTPLDIVDKGFIISSQIERCPKRMMIRELFMNAVEAVTNPAFKGKPIIEIYPLDDDPAFACPKLCIWNTGIGMSARELREAANLASSLGKKMSLDGNFGMGAKVASLPSNQFGLVYRSCKNRRVSEIVLCKLDGIYGLLKQEDPVTGAHVDVWDITDTYPDEADRLEDWTMVILAGNREDQDTVTDPYNGDPLVTRQSWIPEYLYHRFYRLPEGIQVTLYAGIHTYDKPRRTFVTIAERVQRGQFERYECVEADHGIKIHYLYDAPMPGDPGHNKSKSGALQTDCSTAAIIYKKEMFDLKKGLRWTTDAPTFGIPFGSKHISVHVELPDDYPVIHEQYRQFLQFTRGEQDQVHLNYFADQVRLNMPDWVKELIRSLSPEDPGTDEIRDELRKLLQELKLTRPKLTSDADRPVQLEGPRPAIGSVPDLKPNPEAAANPGVPRLTQRRINMLPAGAKRVELSGSLEKVPEVHILHTSEEVEEKDLVNRAGRFYGEAGELFVNALYPSVQKMKEYLENEYAHAADPETMRQLVQQTAEFSVAVNIGRAVVFAIAKQVYKEWSTDAVQRALSPESLSIVADDFRADLQTIKRKLSSKLGSSKAA